MWVVESIAVFSIIGWAPMAKEHPAYLLPPVETELACYHQAVDFIDEWQRDNGMRMDYDVICKRSI